MLAVPEGALQAPAQVPILLGHTSPRNGILDTTLRVLQLEEDAMDWNRVEGNWKQVKGKVKEQWGKLTDDDLDVIAGKQDQLQGKLQERYGYAKDRAQKEMDDWYSRQNW
jgi:uncharacterized protein YjbJ (UPF0337 family)